MIIPTIGDIKAGLFDMDGLLFNSETLYRGALWKMAKDRGREFTVLMHREMMGRSSSESMQVVKDAWESLDSIESLIQERDLNVIEIARREIEIMPGADALVRFCMDRELSHAIVTGSNAKVAAAFVEISQIGNGFQFILDGDQVENGKPAPDIYLKAAEMIGSHPENCLVFEDSLNGVKSAVAAGCHVIACPNEFSLDQDFSIADRRVGSLSEIVSYLGML